MEPGSQGPHLGGGGRLLCSVYRRGDTSCGLWPSLVTVQDGVGHAGWSLAASW